MHFLIGNIELEVAGNELNASIALIRIIASFDEGAEIANLANLPKEHFHQAQRDEGSAALGFRGCDI